MADSITGDEKARVGIESSPANIHILERKDMEFRISQLKGLIRFPEKLIVESFTLVIEAFEDWVVGDWAMKSTQGLRNYSKETHSDIWKIGKEESLE